MTNEPLTIPPDETSADRSVSDRNFVDYMRAGICAFGVGSNLYKPGMTAAEVAERAKVTIDAYDTAIQRLTDGSEFATEIVAESHQAGGNLPQLDESL